MNNIIFEAFSEIKLSDSQKKKLYDKIIKNKASQKNKKKTVPLFYKISLPAMALIAVFCFSVKTFYDRNNISSKLFTGKESEIVFNDGEKEANQADKEVNKETKNEEYSAINEEKIVDKPQYDYKELLLVPKKNSDKTQDIINEDAVMYNEATEESTEEYGASANIFGDFEASQESAEESEKRENEKISSGGGSSSDAKINFSEYDELLNNEKFGEYFPLSQIKDYSFSKGYISGNYAAAYFNSNFHSLTVTVNLLTENSSYGKIKAEREDDNGKYFDVPTEEALITYFISDKNCEKEKIYSMLYSAKYFSKEGNVIFYEKND